MRRSFYNPFIVRKLWRSTSKMMRLPPAFGWVYINSLEYSSDLHRALSRTETPLASRFVHSVTYSYGDYGVRSGVLVDQWFVSAITIQLNVYGKKMRIWGKKMEIWREITLLYSVNQLKNIEVGCHRARFFPTISYNFVLFVSNLYYSWVKYPCRLLQPPSRCLSVILLFWSSYFGS